MAQDLPELLAAARAQVAQRVALGDRLDVPRPIEHLGYFRSAAKAKQVAAQLDALGYVTEVKRATLFKTGLFAKRDEPVDIEAAEIYTRNMHALITAAGGEYDGWGATIVPATGDGAAAT